MRSRLAAACAGLVLVLAACSPSEPATDAATTSAGPAVTSPGPGTDEATASTTDADTSTSITTTSSSTTTVATTVATTMTTAPTTAPPSPPDDYCNVVQVVMVEPGDVLNVRSAPDPNAPIVFVMSPGDITGRPATPPTVQYYNGKPWWRVLDIGMPSVQGWANAFYLTCVVDPNDPDSPAPWPPPEALTDELASRATGNPPQIPWEQVVSIHGLTVEHFDYGAPKHWPATQDPFTDPTVYWWDTEAGGPQTLQATFADQIGQVWLDNVLNDAAPPPTQVQLDTPQQGPEAAPPHIPPIFNGFHYRSFFDPGDDPTANGLDWRTVYVWYEWNPATGWRIRALSFDSWAP